MDFFRQTAPAPLLTWIKKGIWSFRRTRLKRAKFCLFFFFLFFLSRWTCSLFSTKKTQKDLKGTFFAQFTSYFSLPFFRFGLVFRCTRVSFIKPRNNSVLNGQQSETTQSVFPLGFVVNMPLTSGVRYIYSTRSSLQRRPQSNFGQKGESMPCIAYVTACDCAAAINPLFLLHVWGGSSFNCLMVDIFIAWFTVNTGKKQKKWQDSIGLPMTTFLFPSKRERQRGPRMGRKRTMEAVWRNCQATSMSFFSIGHIYRQLTSFQDPLILIFPHLRWDKLFEHLHISRRSS